MCLIFNRLQRSKQVRERDMAQLPIFGTRRVFPYTLVAPGPPNPAAPSPGTVA
jgi:hypothetical protein